MSEVSKQLRVVHKRELVAVGKKNVSVLGYRNDLVEEHLRWHLTQPMHNRWCTVDCMARTMFGRASPENRDRVRRRLGNTFRVLLMRSNLFLVIEYDNSRDGHGKIKAAKIFEAGTGAEGQYAVQQIERMMRRQQITEEMRLSALAAIGRDGTEGESQ